MLFQTPVNGFAEHPFGVFGVEEVFQIPSSLLGLWVRARAR